MTRGMGRASTLLLVALGVGLACEPIVGDPVPLAPVNACPAHACSAYRQSGDSPSCNAGICTVSTPTANLLLVIGLATDSYLAPGRTYITTLNGGPAASGSCPRPLPDCSPPVCPLPPWIQELSFYSFDPQSAILANWNLGNPGKNTTLPVQATFRRLLGNSQDALDLGLPVDPVVADIVTAPGIFPGPNQSAQISFRTYMQDGCYERTLQPYAPLSRAFPPEIKPWPPDSSPPATFDVTREETLPGRGPLVYPQFDIGRAEGLEGWTAYLRNSKTKRVFSNVVPLRGSLVPGVKLLTNHSNLPQGQPFEALTGLELVLQPPVGQPQPTEVFAPTAQEIVPTVTYPTLPTPVTVTGRIETPAGVAVPAVVYFTANDITDRNGQTFPPNFEFTTSVSTTPDKRTGAATYSALLPRGDFRIAVRPTDGANAVTVVSRKVGAEGNEMTGVDIDVGPLVTVSGTAEVADGRSLAEAIVEVLPTACAPIPGSTATTDISQDGGGGTGGVEADTFADCLPREANGQTRDDGFFSLAVDPGHYLLRVRPREGSRLPWKVQSITVGTTGFVAGKVDIPAPINVGMRLTDQAGNGDQEMDNPVINAIVRVFTDPTQTGSAVELGQAITDVNGNYEMYIAPPTQ